MAFRFACIAALAVAGANAGIISNVHYGGAQHAYGAVGPIVAYSAPSFVKTVQTAPALAATYGAVPVATAHTVQPVPSIVKSVSVASTPTVVKTVAPAPALLKTVSVSAAPVVATAPAVPTLAVAAPIVSYAAPVPTGKTHTVTTQAGRSHIHVEEYQQGPLVVRVHEQPAPAPEVVRVAAPSDPQSLIRVINRAAPAPTVDRVVHRSHDANVVDIAKPAPPPARIVQVVRQQGPAPRVEFINEEGHDSVHHLEAQEPAIAYAAPAAAVVKTVHAAPAVATTYEAPAVATTYSTPAAAVKTVHAAPAPAVATTYHHVPAISYAAAPAVSVHKTFGATPAVATTYSTSTYGAPVVSTIGGFSQSYGNTVVLDANKKAKSA